MCSGQFISVRVSAFWFGIVAYFYANLTHYGDLLPYEWSL